MPPITPGNQSVRARRLSAWLLLGVLLAAAVSGVQAQPAAVPLPWESARAAVSRGRIDDLVFARLAKLGLSPARECSDAAFFRRVYLDTIGLPPTREEALRFLGDQRVDKRRVLIDELLARPEFADYWAMHWADLLRVKAEYPMNLWPNAAQAYSRWIHDALRDAMPMNQFARELLVSSGSNFRVGQVNFYRAMQSRDPKTMARMVALTFLGARAEAWPSSKWEGLAGFFTQVGFKGSAEWKEEIVYWDASKAGTGGGFAAVFPDGVAAPSDPARDPRAVFADWLDGAGAPVFRRCQANRVWFWLLGRGLVNEPDDFRADNPPSNPELLDYLAEAFGEAHYDLRQLCRLILNSETYQLSCEPSTAGGLAEENFAVYPLRRLDAEVLSDAIDAITGTHSIYVSAIPEPYTFVPENMRAVQLPDGSISSSFLEMFGRPARDSGLTSERNNRVSAVQRLHLLNSSHVLRKLEEGPALRALFKENKGKPGQLVDAVYLTILSRLPTAEERRLVLKQGWAGAARPRDVAVDLAWALLNSDEFLFQH